MFSTLLQELKSYFGRDFLLPVFLPVLCFVGASLAIFLETRQGLVATLAAWEKIPLLTQTIGLVSGFIVVGMLSFILYNLEFSRLFEGYWTNIPVLHQFRNLRVSIYRKRYDHLTELAKTAGTVTLTNEIVAGQLKFYPPPNHLDLMMPTRFGNVLRGMEIYAYDRYGIDCSILWTRLRPLLSPEASSALENRKLMVDFSLMITLLAALFTLIWCPILALTTNRWGLFLLCALGWPLAWISYQKAVLSAVVYGEQIAATLDLYRHNLLTALKRPLPSDLEEERKEWRRLTRFFYRNVPLAKVVSPNVPEAGWSRLCDTLADYLENLNSHKSNGRGEIDDE